MEVIVGHLPQKTLFDLIHQKHFMNLIDYKNNTGVSGIQRVLSASPPHDTHAFHQPQLPSEFQSKDFQKFQERRRSSSLDSISKSSDFAPLSQSAQGTVCLKKRPWATSLT